MPTPIDVDINHFHFFCGSGFGAKGFNMANPRLNNLRGRMQCIGGIDSDPLAIADFKVQAGVDGTVMDLFSRDQYRAFHNAEPPQGWREATPLDIQRAAGFKRPNIVFLSPPCKGFSGLLSQAKSISAKYAALNALTVRGIMLMCEAFNTHLPEIILIENVPRIQTRGRKLLDEIGAILRHYGYAVAETTHDCGKLGGLAQSRKRFLLVARHIEMVPDFIYQPRCKPLASIGSVLSRLPLPGDTSVGPMHRLPNLTAKTWIRLAFVLAGGDWRSLDRLRVEDGMLADYLLVPALRNGVFGVHGWHDSTGTIAGRTQVSNGAYAVADVRMPASKNRHHGIYRVTRFDHSAHTISGASHVAGAAQSVADPRNCGQHFAKYAVTPFDCPAGTVIGASTTGQGAFAVADPRLAKSKKAGSDYASNGHYGVCNFAQTTGAVPASACHDNGSWSVADPRFPDANQQCHIQIIAEDGTFHRPLSTFELASLQGIVDGPEYLRLAGLSDEMHRQHIGNGVPPPAAKAIAEVMGQTLLAVWHDDGFQFSTQPIWVMPMAIALTFSLPASL
jgi:site-specific DNA-cytosine methylase